jgi:hypothetical protein
MKYKFNIFMVALFATTLLTSLTVSQIDYTSLAQEQQAKPDKPGKPEKADKQEKVPKDKPNKPQKPEKAEKVKNCQVKAQVAILGGENGTQITTQLETLMPQTKTVMLEEGDELAKTVFNFQWKKGDLTCPIVDELPLTVYGTANGEYFTGIIKSITKPNKITYELQGVAIPEEPIPV